MELINKILSTGLVFTVLSLAVVIITPNSPEPPFWWKAIWVAIMLASFVSVVVCSLLKIWV